MEHTDHMTDPRSPSPQQRNAGVIVAAMLTALIRDDSNSADDVQHLGVELHETVGTADAAVGIALQTSAQIIKTLCEEVGYNPVGTMQNVLAVIRLAE